MAAQRPAKRASPGVVVYLHPASELAQAVDPARRGLAVLYRLGEVNHCPGCNGRNWHIGRQTAECARCATALPLAPEGARR